MGCTDKNADEMSLKFGQPDHLAPPSQRQGGTVRWLSLGLVLESATVVTAPVSAFIVPCLVVAVCHASRCAF